MLVIALIKFNLGFSLVIVKLIWSSHVNDLLWNIPRILCWLVHFIVLFCRQPLLNFATHPTAHSTIRILWPCDNFSGGNGKTLEGAEKARNILTVTVQDPTG